MREVHVRQHLAAVAAAAVRGCLAVVEGVAVVVARRGLVVAAEEVGRLVRVEVVVVVVAHLALAQARQPAWVFLAPHSSPGSTVPSCLAVRSLSPCSC